MKYIVIATYEFEIEADSEDEAEKIADGGINYSVINLQTDKRINPEWEVYEKRMDK